MKKVPNWVQEPVHETIMTRNIKEFPGTIQEIQSFYDNPSRKITFGYMCDGYQEIFDMWDFFNSMEGRVNHFWVMDKREAFTLAIDHASGMTSLEVENNRFKNNYRGHERIFVLKTNGDLLTRQVINVTDGATDATLLLTLDTALSWDIDRADVSILGRLYLVRFDVDELTLKFANPKLAEFRVSFHELLREYP